MNMLVHSSVETYVEISQGCTRRGGVVQSFAHFSTRFDNEMLIGSSAQLHQQTFVPAEPEHSYFPTVPPMFDFIWMFMFSGPIHVKWHLNVLVRVFLLLVISEPLLYDYCLDFSYVD